MNDRRPVIRLRKRQYDYLKEIDEFIPEAIEKLINENREMKATLRYIKQ